MGASAKGRVPATARLHSIRIAGPLGIRVCLTCKGEFINLLEIYAKNFLLNEFIGGKWAI
jgi:hypothetical protein